MSTQIRIRADKVVAGPAVLEHAVVTVEDGLITEVSTGQGLAPDTRPVDQPVDVDHHGWLVPGFVDTHVHGGGGAAYTSTEPADVERAIAFFQGHGTTSTFASLVTAEPERLLAQIGLLAPLVRSGELAGIHLEGPFLSPKRRGAHEPSLLIPPDPALIERLLAAGEGTIRMITIAPELPGGLDAVHQIVAAGVTVAIGHTDGDASTTAAALDAGARVATHLFNAMPSIHHRAPGPVPGLLTDPRVLIELICDGVHLDPDVIRMAVAAAGPERVALVTDAMIATGMSDGRYRLGGLEVVVSDGVARLATDDDTPGSIAGSTLTMAAALALVVDRVGVALPDAVQMAATTPARWHGLDDVGEIAPGRRADLVLLDDRGQRQRVMRRGCWLAAPDEANQYETNGQTKGRI